MDVLEIFMYVHQKMNIKYCDIKPRREIQIQNRKDMIIHVACE